MRIAALIEMLRQLRVYQQRKSGGGQIRERGLEFRLADHGEALYAGIDEEAFKPCHSCPRQRRNMGAVETGQPTPGHPVHMALPGGRSTFRFER
jgi:hypothetical protein